MFVRFLTTFAVVTVLFRLVASSHDEQIMQSFLKERLSTRNFVYPKEIVVATPDAHSQHREVTTCKAGRYQGTSYIKPPNDPQTLLSNTPHKSNTLYFLHTPLRGKAVILRLLLITVASRPTNARAFQHVVLRLRLSPFTFAWLQPIACHQLVSALLRS